MSEWCDVPDCEEEAVHLGLCRDHAEEEYGPPPPSMRELTL